MYTKCHEGKKIGTCDRQWGCKAEEDILTEQSSSWFINLSGEAKQTKLKEKRKR